MLVDVVGGVLWRRNLDAVPIIDIDSDRICGVRIRRKCGQDDSWLSVNVRQSTH